MVREVKVSLPVIAPPSELVAPGFWSKLTVPLPVAPLKTPVPAVAVKVPPVIVCSTLVPVAPTSQTVPCSDFVIVPSPVSVSVVVPVAGAQKPPEPLDVAVSQLIVSDEA